MKTTTGNTIIKQISFEYLRNLYTHCRYGKKKYRLVENKLVARDNIRYRLLAKDKHECRMCGNIATHCLLTINNLGSYFIEVAFLKNNKFVSLTVDHIVPMSLGGSRRKESNLQLLCTQCNCGIKNCQDLSKK